MAVIDDILNDLKEYEATPEARGLELRLDLSAIIVRHLHEHGITQKQLAERAGMKESFITRLIHGESNWTSDTAGRVLFALGITARLREVASGRTESKTAGAFPSIVVQSSGTTNGKTKTETTSTAPTRLNIRGPVGAAQREAVGHSRNAC